MKTLNWKNNINESELKEVSECLESGGLVIFPTETVYGLGAIATNKKSVDSIFIAKGRANDNPLIVHLDSKEEIEKYAIIENDIERKLISAFMPGPFTIILKKKDIIPMNVSANLDTVGIRIPANNIANKILSYHHIPVAAPSANISGKPSGTTVEDIIDEFNNKVDYIIDGGNTDIGLESTVVKLIYIKDKKERITYFNEHTSSDTVIIGSSILSNIPCKHFLNYGDTLPEISHNIFKLLREADTYKPSLILIEGVSKEGLGLAIMNRLIRSCSYNYLER